MTTTEPRMQTIENATLDDVRPGDHVTWEDTWECRGVTRTVRREGIAAYQRPTGDWDTADGMNITPGEREGVTLTIRRPVQERPPERDGAVIVHLEHEAIRAKDNTGHLNDFHRLTYDTDTHTWYGMDLAGNLRWTTSRDITPGTWKVDAA